MIINKMNMNMNIYSNNMRNYSIFLTKIKWSKKNDNKIIICSDFETLVINNKLYVHSIGLIYDKNRYHSFTIDLHKCKENTDNILLESKRILKNFLSFLENKFNDRNKIVIYFHNLGLFDGYFLIEYLMEFHQDEIKCLINNNKIYNIVYKNMKFLDSYNIIPYSIDTIGKIYFNRGKKLDITMFIDIDSIIENYINIQKYLYEDVYVLYKVVIDFKKRFEIEDIDITEKYTISSIAFQIFRMKFLNEKEIRTTRFNNYIFLKNAYLGGLNHVRIPHIKNGYYYDVNSLYPYIMKTCYMPVGNFEILFPTTVDIDNFFGFIKCTVFIDKNINIPPLLFKTGKRNNIQATGFLEGTWFSEELKFAISVGAKILKIYKVYSYEKKAIIFDKYVDYFYEKKLNSDNEIDKLIYKLLLNSLYGKFGSNLHYCNLLKVDDKDLSLYELTHVVLNKLGHSWYNLKVDYNIYDNMCKNVNKMNDVDKKEKIEKILSAQRMKFMNSNVCVHISAAISSYSRIKLMKDMYTLINEYKHTIYYYDTDSIITDKKLPDFFVSDKELGKYKLVDELKEGFFIACKVYAYITLDGTEVIKFKGLNKIQKENNLKVQTYADIYYSMKDIEDKKKNIVSYTFNTLLKNLSDLSIYSKNTSFKPLFDTKKYINVYDENNVWIKTEYIYLENPIYSFINMFLLFRYYLNELEYYRFIKKLIK